MCKACNASLQPKEDTLLKHAATKGHKDRVDAGGPSQRKLNFDPKSHERVRQLKEAEIKLSVCMACHSSINTIDHCSEIIKAHGKGSILEDLKLH